MDTLKRLLSYVEIKTKITSVLPFLMTMAYLFSSGYRIDPLRSAVFFAGMFFFDLTATTVNNYADTKKNHQTLQFSRGKAKAITLLLLVISIALGLWLVFLTDAVILFLGALCFFFGVFYSYGPVPLSHGPYGEIVSGFFYGAVIPAIIVYVNDPARLLSYSLSTEALSVQVNIAPTIGLILLAVVPFCLTANVMLANNICDVERDVQVGRYTLPHYLGRASLHLFAFFYYAAYLSVVVLTVLRYLSPLSYLLLITLWPVQRNIRRFFERQIKEETFILAIQNFILISSVHCVLIFLGGFLPGWGPQ